jgi:hypothetical protein
MTLYSLLHFAVLHTMYCVSTALHIMLATVQYACIHNVLGALGSACVSTTCLHTLRNSSCAAVCSITDMYVCARTVLCMSRIGPEAGAALARLIRSDRTLRSLHLSGNVLGEKRYWDGESHCQTTILQTTNFAASIICYC